MGRTYRGVKWSLFKTTEWGRVIQAGRDNAPEALAELCRAYRQPVYCFMRSRGLEHDLAEDLTQGLFASLLAPDALAKVDRGRGRFRDWLRAAAKYYLYNHLDHVNTLARGGREEHVSIGVDILEENVRDGSRDPLSPDRLFDRCWASAVIARVLSRLRDDCGKEGKGELFAHLEGLALGEGPYANDAEFAEATRKTSGAIRIARMRLRGDMQARFVRYLREEIGRTVEGADAIGDEIRVLLDVFA